MTREIVILTKSTKRGGYCVAGVDARSGEWVRLTSSEQWSHGALTDAHMTYADGSGCAILDCVQVEVVRATPIPHQPENVLIDEMKKFQKLGVWTIQDVLRVHPAESPDAVYANTEPFLNEAEMANVDRSLILVRTPWLCIKQRSLDPDKPKTKAKFIYDGTYYNNISVTDPEYYQVESETEYRPAYLIVSLPDAPFGNGLYYKFIAKIFT